VTDVAVDRRSAAVGAPRVERRGARSDVRRDRLFVPATAVLVGSAWLISRYADYKSGSTVGYNLGLAGGIALLLVFLYPLRKRLRVLQSWGATKGWFAVHMACGIGGPFLILVHSRFHIGSINAGVALASMLLVAASGIVGRFIYVRIHHGLYGTRISLAQVQSAAGLSAGEVRSRLHFVPRVEQWLREFEAAAVNRPPTVLHGAWRFLTLGARAQWTLRRCTREFARVYRQLARANGRDAARQQHDLAAGRGLIESYLASAQRVAQFSRFERLFSLWHILHVPLVWMMLFSAVAHVVAVHAY
jgi:hypothetical protein